MQIRKIGEPLLNVCVQKLKSMKYVGVKQQSRVVQEKNDKIINVQKGIFFANSIDRRTSIVCVQKLKSIKYVGM